MTDDPKAQQADPASEDLILELNFVPAWARRPAGAGAAQAWEAEDAGSSGRRGSRSAGERRGDRPRRTDRRRDRGPADRDGRRPPTRNQGDRDSAGTSRRDRPRHDTPPATSEPALPVTVRILPAQNSLTTIVRKISTSRRAYPLVDIAFLLLDNPEACDARVELTDGAALSLYQCTLCRAAATDAAGIIAHLFKAHADDFFETEEKESEPPTGQFSCVCRCGLSGVLLGPPNHHTYNDKLLELHRTRFASMPIEDYRQRVEIVHDPELIEQWKEESRRSIVFRLKKPVDGFPEDADRSVAETFFRRNLADRLYRKTHRAMIPLGVARTLEDGRLRAAIRGAVLKEYRFPLSLLFALRAAFRHMHLHVFRTGTDRNAHFVCARQPTALDPNHAVEAIRAVLLYLREHPGVGRKELFQALLPDQPLDAPAVKETLSQLSWLIEKGHVIEFYNGTLAVPLRGGGGRA